jgi:hypothetical protein
METLLLLWPVQLLEKKSALMTTEFQQDNEDHTDTLKATATPASQKNILKQASQISST